MYLNIASKAYTVPSTDSVKVIRKDGLKNKLIHRMTSHQIKSSSVNDAHKNKRIGAEHGVGSWKGV